MAFYDYHPARSVSILPSLFVICISSSFLEIPFTGLCQTRRPFDCYRPAPAVLRVAPVDACRCCPCSQTASRHQGALNRVSRPWVRSYCPGDCRSPNLALNQRRSVGRILKHVNKAIITMEQQF